MTSMTRGPLPAAVYWRRRFFVLALASVLVFVVVLVGGDNGRSGSDGAARQAAAQPSASSEPTTRSDDDDSRPGKRKKQTRPAKKPSRQPTQDRTPEPPPLATPVGSCVDGDVRVSPTVDSAVAGRPVTITLQLRTVTSEACTWRVSSNHVAVKVTSGEDDIWSTRECPGVVPVLDVVVRRDATSTLDLIWNARRSDDRCPALTEWALPGFYYVAAAALGGEPSDVQFELQAPSPEVIVRDRKNDQKNRGRQDQQNGGGGGNDGNGGGSQGDGGAPSGAVEPS